MPGKAATTGKKSGHKYSLADLKNGDQLLRDVEENVPVARICTYLVLGLVFTLLGCTLGFFIFSDPGGASDGTDPVTIGLRTASTLIGLATGVLLAFFCTGDFGREVDSYGRSFRQATGALLPAQMANRLYGHQSFTLFVTVHHAKNVKDVGGMLPALSGLLKSYDAFVTVACGANPPKATCVRNDETFNETFKLLVAVADEHILVQLKDQDIVHDELVGVVRIKVDDIIDGGFPVFKSYNLTDAEGTKTGQVTLSFDWGKDFDQDKLQLLLDTHPVEFERRKAMRTDAQEHQTKLWERVEQGQKYASHAPASHGPRFGGDAAAGVPASGDMAAGRPRPAPAYGTFDEATYKSVIQGRAEGA